MRSRYENVKVFSEPMRSKKPARFVPKEDRVKADELKIILIDEINRRQSPAQAVIIQNSTVKFPAPKQSVVPAAYSRLRTKARGSVRM